MSRRPQPRRNIRLISKGGGAALDALEVRFACATLTGILAAQDDEPDPEWCCEWALNMGERMATALRKRRRRR